MKIGGFVLGVACGLVGGVAGCVKVCPIFGNAIKRGMLERLVKKALGSEYSVARPADWSRPYADYVRYAGNTGEWSKAREGLKNYVEKQKEEKGEMVYSVMEVLGAEGIFDEGVIDGERTITAKLSAQCSEFRRGSLNGLRDEATPDEYDIRGETFYVYYLRGGDEEPGYVSTVEKRPVVVNYCGTFVTRSNLDISGNVAVLEDEEWGFIEDELGRTEMTFEEYLNSKLK